MKRFYISFCCIIFSLNVLGNECTSKNTHQEFIPIKLEEKTTVGFDQVDLIKSKIVDYITSNPKLMIDQISIIATAPKFPISKKLSREKDNELSLSILAERIGFAQKMIVDLKKNYPRIKQFKTSAEIVGPAYNEIDLNLRFIVPLSSNYDPELKKIFEENLEEFEQKALIKTVEELKAKKNGNLYLDKFKPFLGFILKIESCTSVQDEKLIAPKVFKQ